MGGWIKRDGSWLGRPRKKRKKPAEKKQKKPETTPYGIVFYPIKCPQCASKNIKCYSTRDGGKKRYYRCNDCKYRFKAIESDE